MRVDQPRLSRTATLLRDAPPSSWLLSEAEEMIRGLGWIRAHIIVAGPIEKRYDRGGELECAGIRVPVAAGADRAGAFRDAGELLVETLGPPSIIGSYGDVGPFFGPTPGWGSPYLRWRDEQNTLELRATTEGAELVLQPTEPLENWASRLVVEPESPVAPGYVAIRRDTPTPGLEIATPARIADWAVLTTLLGRFLRTLPAEARALGIQFNIGFHLGGPLAFDINCEDHLEIAIHLDERDIVEPIDAASLGWRTPDELAPAIWHIRTPIWHSGAFGPGEVDGPALARSLVTLLRATGATDGSRLYYQDHATTFHGWTETYDGRYYSLARG